MGNGKSIGNLWEIYGKYSKELFTKSSRMGFRMEDFNPVGTSGIPFRAMAFMVDGTN